MSLQPPEGNPDNTPQYPLYQNIKMCYILELSTFQYVTLSHILGEYFPFKVLFGGEETPNKSVSTFLCRGIVALVLDENNQHGRHVVCGLIETLCFGPIWC